MLDSFIQIRIQNTWYESESLKKKGKLFYICLKLFHLRNTYFYHLFQNNRFTTKSSDFWGKRVGSGSVKFINLSVLTCDGTDPADLQHCRTRMLQIRVIYDCMDPTVQKGSDRIRICNTGLTFREEALYSLRVVQQNVSVLAQGSPSTSRPLQQQATSVTSGITHALPHILHSGHGLSCTHTHTPQWAIPWDTLARQPGKDHNQS